jgi:O-antigen/teichoic acid export membrane protein
MLKRINEKSIVLATRFAAQGIRILSTVIIARLVAKSEYGRFEMIQAVAGLLAALADFGIARAVCNTPDLNDDEVRDTSTVMLVGLSTVFSVLVIGSGWYFDHFFDDPRLRWVGMIMALAYVCQYLHMAQLALLARQLRFGRWVAAEITATAASIGVGIVVAILGGGIFALAFQQLAGHATILLMTLPILPLRWPRRYSPRVARRFFSYGWRVTLFQAHYGLQMSIVRLMIFPRYGDVGVGLYGRAWQIRDLIGQNLACTFEVILTPLLSRGKNDLNRLRDLYLRGNVAVLTFCSLGAAGLAAVASDLVRVFLGRNWDQVPEYLLPMTVGLVTLGMAMPTIILGVALAVTRPLIRFALGSLAMLAIAAVVYFFTDLTTFILVYSLLMALPALDLIRWGTRVTEMPVSQVLRRQWPIVIISALAFLAMYGTRHLLLTIYGEAENLLYALARLLICGAIGLGCSWVLFAVFDRANYLALLNLIVRGQAAPAEGQDAVIALGHVENPNSTSNG